MKKMVCAAALATCGAAMAITDAEIEKLIGEMTLEEKVGQLVQLGSAGKEGGPLSQDATGVALPADVAEMVRKGEVGSLIGACGVTNFNAFQRIAMNEARVKIPLMVGHDMIHGVMTQAPIPLALSCAWDEKTWQDCGRLIAVESPAKGCNWTFTPMVDMCRDPRWGRIAEGPGQDPYLGGKMGAAMVKGIQSKAGALPVAACLKHFAAYGGAEAGRDYNTVEMSESTFRNVYLPPFKAGVEAGALTVMPAFNTLNGVPCSVNKWLLTDILRDHLAFKGFTISDWCGVSECELDHHGMAETHAGLVELAMDAGMDQDMMAGLYRKELVQLVKDGKVPMAQVDRSVRNILQVKNALGLWENPYIDEAKLKAQIDLAAHARQARAIAAKCCVLLKNEKDTLPLKPGVKVALVGPGAEDCDSLSGTWSAYIENKFEMTLPEGLRGAGVTFTYTPGYDWQKGRADAKALKAAAKEADVVVALFGQKGTDSGEGWSVLDITLPKVQLEALNVLKRTKKPLVAVLINGRPLAIPELAEKADAILEAWCPGTSAGGAIADVLTGKVNPEGRLTTEFPVSVGQLPLYYNRLRTGRPSEVSAPYCSCYRDGPHQALYPFGYGLGYATFAYANELVKVEGEGEGRKVVLSCDVTNTGKVAGVETVQAYTRQMVGVESRPIRELRGWQKVALAPGETKHVTIEVPVAQLGYWSKDRLVPAAGPMRAWITRDSASGKTLEFRL